MRSLRSIAAVTIAIGLVVLCACKGEEKSGSGEMGASTANEPSRHAKTDCQMRFSLSGWSAFYKTASGFGEITCDNGQKANIKITAKGGGLTFGKSKVVDATGKFSEVGDISELFGSYAQAEAHAGAVKSSEASVVTKGDVSLALAGTGRGVDLGVSFGKFEIERR